ncbi:hypothetical protein [Sorangium sp. So ce1389]|uniref:hypothetical protein n=1 Tax=Sorangium sp. So ce1389 TaxID=3133336 RepID=UPI003F62F0CA
MRNGAGAAARDGSAAGASGREALPQAGKRPGQGRPPLLLLLQLLLRSEREACSA